jgi:hypothetical protein
VVKVVDGHRARLPIAAKSPRVWAYANGRGATNQVVDQVGVGKLAYLGDEVEESVMRSRELGIL